MGLLRNCPNIKEWIICQCSWNIYSTFKPKTRFMFYDTLDLKSSSARLHQNLSVDECDGRDASPLFIICCLWCSIVLHLWLYVQTPFCPFGRKIAEVLKMRFMHCEKHIWLCAIQNIHRSILFCTIINPLFILREAGWLHKKTGNNFFWPFCTRFLAKEMPFEMSKNSYLQSFLPDTFTWSGADQPD